MIIAISCLVQDLLWRLLWSHEIIFSRKILKKNFSAIRVAPAKKFFIRPSLSLSHVSSLPDTYLSDTCQIQTGSSLLLSDFTQKPKVNPGSLRAPIAVRHS